MRWQRRRRCVVAGTAVPLRFLAHLIYERTSLRSSAARNEHVPDFNAGGFAIASRTQAESRRCGGASPPASRGTDRKHWTSPLSWVTGGLAGGVAERSHD